MIINGLTVLISGNYSAFKDGFNNAGVYMGSGLIPSQTFKIPAYIGSAEDLKERIVSEHIAISNKGEYYNKTNQILFNYSVKYGSENVVWFLLETCEEENTLIIEQKYLDLYRPFADEFGGFNIAHFADSSMKGRKHSLESIAKMGKKGEEHWNFGKKHSEKTRKRMSENHADFKGEKSPCFGKVGVETPMFGRHHSEETKNKIAASRAKTNNKKYRIVSPSGELFVTDNLSGFCKEKNIQRAHIRQVIKGERRHHKGWTKAAD